MNETAEHLLAYIKRFPRPDKNSPEFEYYREDVGLIAAAAFHYKLLEPLMAWIDEKQPQSMEEVTDAIGLMLNELLGDPEELTGVLAERRDDDEPDGE